MQTKRFIRRREDPSRQGWTLLVVHFENGAAFRRWYLTRREAREAVGTLPAERDWGRIKARGEAADGRWHRSEERSRPFRKVYRRAELVSFCDVGKLSKLAASGVDVWQGCPEQPQPAAWKEY